MPAAHEALCKTRVSCTVLPCNRERPHPQTLPWRIPPVVNVGAGGGQITREKHYANGNFGRN